MRSAHVWKFENRRFLPVGVQIGVSDDFSTEIVGGPLQAGDVVVTDAVPSVEMQGDPSAISATRQGHAMLVRFAARLSNDCQRGAC